MSSTTKRDMNKGAKKTGRQAASIKSLADPALARQPTGETNIYRHFLGLRTSGNRLLNVIEEVKRGLPLSAGETLAGHMGVEIKTFFTAYVGMSESTARRRLKSQAGFTVDESDRLVRYAHLLQRATQLMEGDETDAREWMLTPAPALGGNTPLETADTETGARRVEDLILSLEYGMFS